MGRKHSEDAGGAEKGSAEPGSGVEGGQAGLTDTPGRTAGCAGRLCSGTIRFQRARARHNIGDSDDQAKRLDVVYSETAVSASMGPPS